MSRDFKPFELYLTDKEHNNLFRNGNVIFTLNTGEVINQYENEVAKQEYPEAHFLLSGFDTLYDNNKDNLLFIEVVDRLELSLKELEAELNASLEANKASNFISRQFSASDSIDRADLSKNNVEDVAKAWFYGNLDRDFYYNEYNNELMISFIKEKSSVERDKTKDKNYIKE